MPALDTLQPAAGWEVRDLGGLLCHIIDFRGRTPKKLGMDWGCGTIPALSANNVKMGEVNLSEPTFYGSETLYTKWMTNGENRKGDVLLTMEAPLGNVAQVPDEKRYILSQRVVLLRFDDRKMINVFAAHQIRSERVQRNLTRWSTGTTATGIQRARLIQIPLFVPPLGEQRRIAEILDMLDEAIRKTELLIAKLKQVKQGLLHDLLTRGIDDNGELRDPTRHPEQFKASPLGPMPQRWNVIRMAELTSRIVDGVHRTPTYLEAGIPFLTVENLTRGPSISFEPCRFVSAVAHREYVRRADPQPGDVLVSKDGTLGVARVVPQGLPEFSIFVSVAILRPRLDLILPELIETFFETSLFLRQLGTQSAGTGLKHIHLEHFREFRLAVPPLDEQDRIFGAVGGLRGQLAAEEDTLGKLRRLKQGLMEDLLTGRVRVTNLLSEAAP